MVDFSEIFFTPLAAFFIGLSAALAANGKHRISYGSVIRKLLFAMFALLITRPLVEKTEWIKNNEFVLYALCGAFGNKEMLDIAKRIFTNIFKGFFKGFLRDDDNNGSN